MIPIRVGIDATEDNVTAAERKSLLLPSSRQTHDPGLGIDGIYQSPSDRRFTCTDLRISASSSNQAVQIAILHLIGVADNKITDSKMCQLLCDMGTTTAEANNPDSASSQNFTARATQKTLAGKSINHTIPLMNRIGAPTMVNSLIRTGF